MRRLAVVVVYLGLALRPAPTSAQAFVPSDEAAVQHMVNATRAQHGLPALVRLDGLVDVARGQSARMVQQQNLFHNPHLAVDITATGLDWSWTGENVGVGPDVATIEDAFLASTHHYENIVRDNYNAIGVGVVADSDHRIYVTQVFAQIKGLSGPVVPQPPAPTAPPAPPPSTPSPAPTPSTPKPPLPPPPPKHVVIEGGVVAPASPLPDLEAAEDDGGRSAFQQVTALFSRLLGIQTVPR